MIPRVAKLGTGFVGAGLYYLHDKREDQKQGSRPSAEDYHLHDKGNAQTSERVGFTATRNLPTQDAAKGLKCMAWLAANAHSVRQAAVAAEARASGMSYDAYVRAKNPFRGRKQQKPVYSMSIAWHPTKNRKPTRAQMVAAADEVLGVLGLTDHQAVIVEHTDRKHPHVHLIVNRVHPTTGKFARLGNDYLKVSKWALDYEKRTGLIVCPVRVDNWQKRDVARVAKAEARKTNPKAKGQWVLAKDVPRGDHEWFKSVAHLPPEHIRQARRARQERERETFRGIADRRTNRVDAAIERRYGPVKREVDQELERLLRAEGWRKHRDRHPVALILQPTLLVQSLIDVFTARAYFRPRRIKALDKASNRLRLKMRDRRHVEKGHQTAQWTRMMTRHAAERRRDEDRIAALARAARGKGSSERGRKVFNWRSGVETARHVPPHEPIIRLSDIHDKVVDKAKAAQLKARHALSNAIRTIGGSISTEQLRKYTLGGWTSKAVTKSASNSNSAEIDTAEKGEVSGMEGQQPVNSEDRTEAMARTTSQGQNTPSIERLSHRPTEYRDAANDRAAFEARRDAAQERIEAEQAQSRRRRKRERPRGKTREMD